MFGIKLQLRSFSIKRCYSFRPIASYRDARGEETHAHTHAHLFLVKWFVTLSEIACRLPGFQRGKDRITIIGKSIGVSSPGYITSMKRPTISKQTTGILSGRARRVGGHDAWKYTLHMKNCQTPNTWPLSTSFPFNGLQEYHFQLWTHNLRVLKTCFQSYTKCIRV